MALCAGAGGLELGLHIALGDDYRCVVYVEREAYAAATLVARMADQALDTAPVWDDLTTFDGKPWRGSVDIVSAGFSCQPWSAAGKQLGIEDERWIWPDIERIVREVEPEWVFLENVAGLVRGGLEHVLRGLAVQGFDAEWDTLSAAEVGAPHLRTRLFILAYRSRQRPGEARELQSEPSQRLDGRGTLVANAAS
jgi:DNA (cytosine-5)-methyltransferase 1